ncbi:hypothetical protein [Lysinibacillus sp. C5.1]|uniref:hypothetical protein n=1 Tax=Lysinibacillus sp. C5.1 TaxID=2796169 RepID=UPI0030815B3C
MYGHKEWLGANSPEIKKTFKGKKKEYSLEVDRDLLKKTQKIISTWSEIEKERSKFL